VLCPNWGPLQVKSRPKLWQGAWSPQQRFTQADVKAVVEYARMRAVRVMIEFDMPGHAASWCTGYGNFDIFFGPFLTCFSRVSQRYNIAKTCAAHRKLPYICICICV